jgi:nitric oxide reductase activation protein
MLILTDGQPSDIDVTDDKLLVSDAREALIDSDQQGIFTYCISLDKNADKYVGDIFGKQFSVIDRIEKLPEQLTKLFMTLTH